MQAVVASYPAHHFLCSLRANIYTELFCDLSLKLHWWSCVPRYSLSGGFHRLHCRTSIRGMCLWLNYPDILSAEWCTVTCPVLFQTTLELKNLTSASRTVRVIPPNTPYFSIGLGEPFLCSDRITQLLQILFVVIKVCQMSVTVSEGMPGCFDRFKCLECKRCFPGIPVLLLLSCVWTSAPPTVWDWHYSIH